MLDSKYEGDIRSSIDNIIAVAKKIDQDWDRISGSYRKTDLARRIDTFPKVAEKFATAILGPNAESLKMFAEMGRPSRKYGTMRRNPEIDIEIMRRGYEEQRQADRQRIREMDGEIEDLNDLLTIPEIVERSG